MLLLRKLRKAKDMHFVEPWQLQKGSLSLKQSESACLHPSRNELEWSKKSNILP